MLVVPKKRPVIIPAMTELLNSLITLLFYKLLLKLLRTLKNIESSNGLIK